MNWCILIPLLEGLISALFGYLLGRLFRGGNDDSDRIAKLEADGFDKPALKIIYNYLKKQMQRTKVNGA